MLLDGMHLPLTTPFTLDGRLNLRKFEDNVRRYSKTPAAGLMVLAANGQPTLLSDFETREALRVVAETTAPEKVLTAGVRRDSVVASLALIAYAAEVGYDAVLVPVPSIVGTKQIKEMLSFFRAVADKAALPILLDSDGTIPVEVMVELAYDPKIIGVVDGGSDAARIAEVLNRTTGVRREATVTPVFAAVTGRMLARSKAKNETILSANALATGGTVLSVASPSSTGLLRTRAKTVGFQVLCARTAQMLEALIAGAVGAAPPLAVSAPQGCYEVLAAWKDGDPALAAEKQERLRIPASRVEEQLGVAGIKYACDLNGYFGGRPRLPTLPLMGAERLEVEGLMGGIRN